MSDAPTILTPLREIGGTRLHPYTMGREDLWHDMVQRLAMKQDSLAIGRLSWLFLYMLSLAPADAIRAVRDVDAMLVACWVWRETLPDNTDTARALADEIYAEGSKWRIETVSTGGENDPKA